MRSEAVSPRTLVLSLSLSKAQDDGTFANTVPNFPELQLQCNLAWICFFFFPLLGLYQLYQGTILAALMAPLGVLRIEPRLDKCQPVLSLYPLSGILIFLPYVQSMLTFDLSFISDLISLLFAMKSYMRRGAKVFHPPPHIQQA